MVSWVSGRAERENRGRMSRDGCIYVLRMRSVCMNMGHGRVRGVDGIYGIELENKVSWIGCGSRVYVETWSPSAPPGRISPSL
jgi:hypothetical protein